MMQAVVLFAALAVAGDGYSWRPFNDGTADHALHRGGVQVGCYQASTGRYFPLDARSGKFGPACRPPVEAPALNFGLLPADQQPRSGWLAGGMEISEQEAWGMLKDTPAPAVPDDATANRLLVIGADNDVEPVRLAFESDTELSPWRGKIVFQTARPDDWRIAGYGFKAEGKPVIYYLAADGTVLHRQDDFDGGAAGLAEALRNADATYSPEKDTDQRSMFAALFGRFKSIPPAGLVLGALVLAAAVLLIMRRGN